MCNNGIGQPSQLYSRFTCSKIAVLFACSFQAALFSFADLRKNEGFSPAESPFLLESAKKKEPLEKNF